MTETELANLRHYMNQLIIQLNAINRELERIKNAINEGVGAK